MKDVGLPVKRNGKMLTSLEQWVDQVWPWLLHGNEIEQGKSGSRETKELFSIPHGERGAWIRVVAVKGF